MIKNKDIQIRVLSTPDGMMEVRATLTLLSIVTISSRHQERMLNHIVEEAKKKVLFDLKYKIYGDSLDPLMRLKEFVHRSCYMFSYEEVEKYFKDLEKTLSV